MYIKIYLLLMTAVGFASMGIDKAKAKARAWRTPELLLLLIAAAGGSLGSLAGMYFFRHKTKHPKFFVGIPLILAAQIIIALLIINL